MYAEPSPFCLSSKKVKTPVRCTSQSAGTSKAVPYLGLTTTFHPATVGFSPSPERGLSVAADVGEAGEVAVGDGLAVRPSLPSSASSSFEPPSTRKPVTAAVTTTAVAATTATSFVRPPPRGGSGADGCPHCGGCP